MPLDHKDRETLEDIELLLRQQNGEDVHVPTLKEKKKAKLKRFHLVYGFLAAVVFYAEVRGIIKGTADLKTVIGALVFLVVIYLTGRLIG